MSLETWIVVAGDPAVDNLTATARSLGGPVTAAVVGSREAAERVAVGGVDKVLWFDVPAEVPAEAFAGAVAQVVADAAPALVLAAKRPADRVLLGASAARLRAAAFADVDAVRADGDAIVLERSVFGGIAQETDMATGPVAVLVDGGALPAAVGKAAPVEPGMGTPYAVTATQAEEAAATGEIDLAVAERVVGVGRGLKSQDDLSLINDLATAVKGEVACSRPLAEGQSWLTKSRYLGISGRQIAPKLYIAVGISGQLQHMVGVRGAGTIVAVNSDKDAKIFQESDYGLVGDLYALVPALTRALRAS